MNLFVWCLLATCWPLIDGAERLVWSDEFDTLDLDRWYHLVTTWTGGNHHFNYYRNDRRNSYVKDGILHIEPTLTVDERGESGLTTGILTLEGCTVHGNCTSELGQDIIFPLASARMSTERSFNFGFNHKVKVRAKMPRGDWLWPAIWMMPKDDVYGEWPRSGEINIVESRGNWNLTDGTKQTYGVNKISSVLHFGSSWKHNGYQHAFWGTTNNDEDFSENFHDYEFIWTKKFLSFYVDGNLLGKAEPPNGDFWKFGHLYDGQNPWEHRRMAPFDQKFHFILNLNVGGTNHYFRDDWTNVNSPKPWNNNSPHPRKDFWDRKDDWFPTWDRPSMQVDYIRVYKI